MPVGLAVAGDNCVDFKLVRETINSIPIERPRPTRRAPQGMCLDKGYDYLEVWESMEESGFTPHIAIRDPDALAVRHPGAGARRWVVERTHSWMNRFRGILTCWCKKPENFLGLLHFACGLIAFRRAGLFG